MVKPALNPFKELAKDLKPVLPYIGRWIQKFFTQLANYKSGQRQNNRVINVVLILLRYPAQFILTISALLLNALASLINNVGLRGHERALSEQEIAYLRAVFGDQLNYALIRIQTGGIKERLRISPQAVGNDIFLRRVWWGSVMVEPDQSLSPSGFRILGHEACHVWQYQHHGAGYIGDSLLIQMGIVLQRQFGFKFTDGYNLKPALESRLDYAECNTEQQAVMAELIGVACAQNKADQLNRDAFHLVSKLDICDAEYALVERAHIQLCGKK